MLVCGICGLKFESQEDHEKHIFHYKNHRWRGIKTPRTIEQNPELAGKVHEARMKKGIKDVRREMPKMWWKNAANCQRPL